MEQWKGMMQGQGSGEPTPEQLARINQFSRRELTKEEVYVFSLVLCDNQIDRDFQRFPADSLEKLAQLFVGKTGIFDHNPKGENQTARIFQAQVEPGQEGKAPGEPYQVLRAWAYMLRCQKNQDLILEIDGGIKKEVSVGCAVERVICSICGADARKEACGHQPGETYQGKLCWQELENPTDAYEWSFVAVPAQKRAGVVKGKLPDTLELCKALEAGSLTLTREQGAQLAGRMRELEELAQAGQCLLGELRKRFVAQASFALPGLDGETASEIALRLSQSQLEACCKAMRGALPISPQLAGGGQGIREDQSAFQI